MSELYRLRVEIRVATMLCVGGPGRPHPLADQVVAVDEQGRPYVPASTVRGRLRAHLERLLWAYGQPVCNPPRPAHMCPHAGLQDVPGGYCRACRLFGSPWREGSIRVGDFHLAGGTGPGSGSHPPVRTVVRTGVGIGRRLATVAEGKLFFTEAVVGGMEEDAARFVGEIGVMADHRGEIGWLMAAMSLVSHLGGHKGRGLGRVSMELGAVSRWLGGSEWEPLDATQFRREVVDLALSGAVVR
ncbi:MAG: RAMP superfamily CRISPR-associated protein [Moorellales bacterium]